MAAVAEMDEKGRILIPKEIRQRLRSRRFEVRNDAGALTLVPLPEVKALRGKYRGLIKSDWEALEKKAEKFLGTRKR